jgi:hypothetical protein
MLSSKYTFTFVSRKKMKSLKQKSDVSSTRSLISEEKNISEIKNSESDVDANRRAFLKIAGLTGHLC